MLFNLFRSKQQIKKDKQTRAAEGFKTLVGSVKTYAIDDVPNRVAVLLTLYFVDLSVRVSANVVSALQTLSPEKGDIVQDVSKGRREPEKQRSLKSRPVRPQSMGPKSDEEDSVSNESFTFGAQPSAKSFTFAKMPQIETDNGSMGIKGDTPKGLATSASLSCVPEHALLKGFVRQSSRDCHRPPVRHARHLSFDESKYPPLPVDLSVKVENKTETPPSPFMMSPLPNQTDGGRFDLDEVDRVDSLITINESDSGPKIKAALVKSNLKTEGKVQQTKQEEDYEESVYSSPRSAFSDSVTRFHSNFCNPEFYEEPMDMMSSLGCGGSSMRQRYTIKRLQSLINRGSLISKSSHRSSQSPNGDGIPAITPGSTNRSFRSRSFRGKSFCSRAGDEEGGCMLSDAYRMVRLESQIRRAWKLSHDVEAGTAGGASFRESDGKQSPALASFRKSRRFDRSSSKRISFVKVPDESSKDNILASRRNLLLNPAFGEAIEGEHDDTEYESASEGETDMDTASVAMRTPLRRLGSQKLDFKKCQKNPEEGAYDNPLRLCSFRSYDSDTELELTSVKVRNPISRLLSFRLNRGVNSKGISLAELNDDANGASMFDEVNANPIRDGMLEKYLTQLVIDGALDAKMTGDACDTEDERNWSTCQQEWVPQELDDKLKCFLMDRFLLDNVLNEMDVNLGALEIARVAQSKKKPSPAPQSSSRTLRRS